MPWNENMGYILTMPVSLSMTPWGNAKAWMPIAKVRTTANFIFEYCLYTFDVCKMSIRRMILKERLRYY